MNVDNLVGLKLTGKAQRVCNIALFHFSNAR